MKLSEVFGIYTTNEEQTLLDKMSDIVPVESYTEREQFIIENLIRKSLVSKVRHNQSYLVVKNEYSQ
jgi:hypothetical protein